MLGEIQTQNECEPKSGKFGQTKKVMAHQISEVDYQEGTFMAWHGKTAVKSDLTLANCKLQQLEFESIPLFLKNGTPAIAGQNEQGENVPFAILRDAETQAFIGQPYNPTTFFPIPHRAFLDAVAEAVSNIKEIKMTSCGTHSRRACIYLSFDIQDAAAKFSIGKHRFKSRLNMGRGITGLEGVWSNTSTIDTVCANTHAMNKAIAIAGQKAGNPVCVHFKQTKNCVLKLDNMAKVIDSSLGLMAQFSKAMEVLGNQTVKEQEAREFYAGFLLPGNKPGCISTRAENTRERLVSLFRNGRGNLGQSRLDLFSGITDYYTHESSGGDNRWKQYVSSEFGSASRIKEDALPMLLDNAKFEAIVTLGRNSIRLTNEIEDQVRNFAINAMN